MKFFFMEQVPLAVSMQQNFIRQASIQSLYTEEKNMKTVNKMEQINKNVFK